MAHEKRRYGAVIRRTHFIVAILASFLYQAAVGGLFFLVAKQFSYMPRFASVLLMVEPLLLLALGISIAKRIDQKKHHAHRHAIGLAALSFLALLLLYQVMQHPQNPAWVLTAFACLMGAFMVERILRQRLPKAFSLASGAAPSQVNAIANLANRGAPILSPVALYFFPNGLTFSFILLFLLLSIGSTTAYLTLQKSAHPHALNHSTPPPSPYEEKRLGLWHILHLFLLNLSMGGLFLILSQHILINTEQFFSGPSGYFAGFWIAMVLMAIRQRSTDQTPYKGLMYTGMIGILLLLSSQDTPITPLILMAAGFAQGFAINHLGTFIQTHLPLTQYAYYETRAQRYGRIALLISLFGIGYLQKCGLQLSMLQSMIGLSTLASALLLLIVFNRFFVSLKNPVY